MKKSKIILGATLGNIMEFYNFMIYVFLAKNIAAHFYPTTDESVATLFSFGVFATGYLSRPFGSMIFGYIGDKYSRKLSLLLSIFMMTTATLLMAFIPSYQTIGITAPLFLTFLRIVQGLCVSGEEGAAVIYLSESLGERKEGESGGLILSSVYIGVILALLACYFVRYIDSPNAWKIPFYLSVIFGVVCYALRSSAPDSSKKIVSNRHINPIKSVFLENGKTLALCILLIAPQTVAIYFYIFSLKSFLPIHNATSDLSALLDSILSMVVIIISVYLLGKQSKTIKSHWKNYMVGIFLLFLTCILSGSLLTVQSYGFYIFIKGMLALSITFLSGTVFAVLQSKWQNENMCTGVSLSFNTGTAIFGCTAPIIFTYIKTTSDPFTYLVFYGGTVFLIGIFSCYFLYYKNKRSHSYLRQEFQL